MWLDDVVTRLDPLLTTPIAVGYMPPEDDERVVVNEYDISPPAAHDDHHMVGLQVRCRSASYDTARADAFIAYHSLHKLANTTVGSTLFVSVLAQGEPAPMSFDGRRTEYVVNFRALM
jgi:hypothetical protein